MRHPNVSGKRRKTGSATTMKSIAARAQTDINPCKRIALPRLWIPRMRTPPCGCATTDKPGAQATCLRISPYLLVPNIMQTICVLSITCEACCTFSEDWVAKTFSRIWCNSDTSKYCLCSFLNSPRRASGLPSTCCRLDVFSAGGCDLWAEVWDGVNDGCVLADGARQRSGSILVCSWGWFYDWFDQYLLQSPPTTSPSKP